MSTVALVSPYSFARSGGVQNHVLGLAGWLKEQGHEVALFGPGRPTTEALRASGLGSEEFTSAGRAIPVPYNGSVARVNFGLAEALRVRRWLRSVRPDVVHVHEPITPSVAVLSVWAAGDVPVVATFHTATPGSRTMALARRVLPATIRRVDRGIAVSRVARRVVVDHVGLAPTVIGNGIRRPARPDDLDRSSWRGGQAPRITFVGRYDEPRKGFDVFVDALPLLRAHYPGADIVVVGEGRARPVPGARFLGLVTDSERDALLASTDVYVAPHVGRESFGIVLLEALAAGADVVASDLPAFTEVLTDRHGLLAGTIVPTGDPVALAGGVLRALEHPDPDRRVRGWELAGDYDWQTIGPQVLDVYADVLDPFGARARRVGP